MSDLAFAGIHSNMLQLGQSACAAALAAFSVIWYIWVRVRVFAFRPQRVIFQSFIILQYSTHSVVCQAVFPKKNAWKRERKNSSTRFVPWPNNEPCRLNTPYALLRLFRAVDALLPKAANCYGETPISLKYWL